MKLERLIGIITVLGRQGKVTAPYLAEKFEVSRRTIQRDITDICAAGIPIVTEQGSGGGISLMEGFTLDTTVFTKNELSAILTGLKTLDSVSNSAEPRQLMQKFTVPELPEYISIDLASFYKNDLADKIERIRAAIAEQRCVRFRYYYNKGEADKCVEPYQIMFKWSDWYLYGFSPERGDFRMYKLRRLWELVITDEHFTPHEMPAEQSLGLNLTDDYYVTAIYEPSEKYRLVEEYGPHSFTVTDDGQLYTRWGFSDTDFALRWFLSFGDRVTVTDPPEMVVRIREASGKIYKKYGGT